MHTIYTLHAYYKANSRNDPQSVKLITAKGYLIQNLITATQKTIGEVAKGLGISCKVLSQILNGHAGISEEMAIKLSVAFDTSGEFWLNLQKNYDLWQAKQKVDTSMIKHFLVSA